MKLFHVQRGHPIAICHYQESRNMSSRALRRLERQRERLASEEAPEVDDEVEYQHPPQQQKAKKNLFALIGDNSDDDVDDHARDDTDEAVKPEPMKVSLPTKSQKRKNKKKVKAQVAKEDSEDEFDKVLKEYGIEPEQAIDTTQELDMDEDDEDDTAHFILDPSFRFFTPKKQVRCAKLLSVDTKDLDPDNEFKKLFGKLSQEAIDDANSTTSTSIPPEDLQKIRRMARIVRGWGGRDRRSIPGTTRKLVLTKIRDDWIPTQKKDMTIEELTAREIVQDRLSTSEDWIDVINNDVTTELKYGIKYYKFERGEDSKMANSQFFASVVLRPNHEAVAQLLGRYPYHVETILQVALILIRQGDKSNSNGLVERALFAFDRAFKQSFEIGNGLSRLPFNYYLNREFYLAIFRYIQVLTKKGTHYTAFTYAKLLLSLDPSEDPFGVRYFIDFYACIAGEFQWLVDFVNSALVKTYTNWYTPGLAYSCPLALLSLGKHKEAKEALQRAFVVHPYTGYKLLESIGLADDIPVNDYSVFEVGPEIEATTTAYLLQAPAIWKNAQDRTFLHDTLLEFIRSEIALDNTREKNGLIPNNFIRFAILSDEGKVMAKIPKEWWEENEIFEYDILPPKVGNVERLEDFIDDRIMNSFTDDEHLMEMVRNMSLQELIDNAPHD